MNLFKSKTFIFLALILFLALFLRLINLNSVPVGLHEDEAQIGYNAYSILQTGSDKNGHFMPLAVDQFGDFRPAGYHYLVIPSILTFGLTEFAVRFPSAIIGSLIVILVFLISKTLLKSERAALLSSLLVAVTPWHVLASRATSESIVAMFFVLLGVFSFLYYYKKRDIKFLIYSFLFFSISFLFYHSARFFVPLLSISASFLFVYLVKLKSKEKFALFVFNAAIVLSMIGVLFLAQGDKRPAAVSIFSTQETQLVMDEQIREDGGQNPLITRAFHNKVINYSYTFVSNYLLHFSGDFLFMKGGLPSRYLAPNTGMILPIFIPFLFLGLAFLQVEVIRERKYFPSFILLWLLLGPVPSALTWEDIPNFQRSIMMLPPLIMIIAYGVMKTVNSLRGNKFKKVFIAGFTLLFIFNFLYFAHNYFGHTSTHRPWERSVGQKELVTFLKDYVGGDKKVILTKVHANQPIFFLFYLKMPPEEYQKNQAKLFDGGDIVYKNLIFTEADCPLYEEFELNKIYVNRGECVTPPQAIELKEIKRTDGTTAFKVLRATSLP